MIIYAMRRRTAIEDIVCDLYIFVIRIEGALRPPAYRGCATTANPAIERIAVDYGINPAPGVYREKFNTWHC